MWRKCAVLIFRADLSTMRSLFVGRELVYFCSLPLARGKFCWNSHQKGDLEERRGSKGKKDNKEREGDS